MFLEDTGEFVSSFDHIDDGIVRRIICEGDDITVATYNKLNLFITSNIIVLTSTF